MCKPAPGPRCAGHLRKMIETVTGRLDAATARGTAQEIAVLKTERATLRFDYHGTRTGQRELTALIDRTTDPVQRPALEAIRRDALAAYDTKKERLAAVTKKAATAPAVTKVAPAPARVPAAPPAPPQRPAITEFDRRTALAELRSRNIATVRVHFSGGNDEGGADSIVATHHNGTKSEFGRQYDVYQDHQTKKHMVYGYGTGGSPREATNEEVTDAALTEALEAPVLESYGGFGGAGYTRGAFTWDVDTGSVSETEHEYESPEEDQDDGDRYDSNWEDD